MSISIDKSNAHVHTILSTWEQTPKGEWERLKVEVNDKGDFKLQRIAQNTFQHLLSYILQRLTFGLIKDILCRKIDLITVHVDPQNKEKFLENESRKIANFVNENKTFDLAFSAITTHIQELIRPSPPVPPIQTPIAEAKPDKQKEPTVEVEEDVIAAPQPKEVPAEVVQWRETQLQAIHKELTDHKENSISHLGLAHRFDEVAISGPPSFDALKNARLAAWEALKQKIENVTDPAGFKSIEEEIAQTQQYDDALLKSLRFGNYPHHWLEGLSYTLSEEYDKLPVTNNAPLGRRTLEQLKTIAKDLKAENKSAWTPKQQEAAESVIMHIDILEKVAAISAELITTTHQIREGVRVKIIEDVNEEQQKDIATLYDQVIKQHPYDPNATLEDLIATAGASFENISTIQKAAIKLAALSEHYFDLKELVDEIQAHLENYGDTYYLTSARLADSLSRLADEGNKVHSFDALANYYTLVEQEIENLENDLVFAQFIHGVDLPTRFRKEKEIKLSVLQDLYHLGNFETIQGNLNAQHLAFEEARKGFRSAGWFTTSVIPISEQTEDQRKAYQKQVVNMINEANKNLVDDGILTTAKAYTYLKNLIDQAEQMISKAPEAPDSSAAETLKQIVSEQTQEVAKQAKDIPSTDKNLEPFALNIYKAFLTIKKALDTAT